MNRAEILVSLDKVLWAPEGDRITRREWGISRHANEISLNFWSRNRIHVYGRADWIGTQRLEQIQPVENNLRLAGECRAEGMNQGEQETIVRGRLPRIVSGVRAVGNGAGKHVALLQRVAAI